MGIYIYVYRMFLERGINPLACNIVREESK